MPDTLHRRAFLEASAAGTAALAFAPWVHARGSDTLRLGLIGCGGRGTGAAANCVESSPGIEVVAMGDLFADRLRSSREQLAVLGEALRVSDETCFTGFDAYRGVLACEVDIVILATPPHFRPEHLRAAIEAGKHVFLEKPVAVDPVGVRTVIEASERARETGLAIVAGTQRRHQASYLETIERIQGGAIGELLGGSCYWNQGGLWMHPRRPEWSDAEWQIRNWLYFTWLSGDHIVEQHVHNLDVMNWVFGGHPLRATGMGGREVRTDPAYGNVFDHFAVEYEYPGGRLVHSYCRQIDGCATQVGERVIGSRGSADPAGTILGARLWRFEGQEPNPYVQEHADWIASIRAGRPLNEGRQVAESTQTAILGRLSAYTGKSLEWEEASAADLRLGPPAYALGDLPIARVPVPGATPLAR